MSVSGITLYQILKDRPGDKEAAELGYLVSSGVRNEFDSRKEIFGTNGDLGNVKSELRKPVYFGLSQLLAITGPVLAIINFAIE